MSEANDESSREAATSNAELERLAFEVWFSGGNRECRSIDRSGESYKLIAAHQAWKAWQARASVQIVRGEYVCPKCGLRQSLGMKVDCEF
jgi:hypothetical protein